MTDVSIFGLNAAAGRKVACRWLCFCLINLALRLQLSHPQHLLVQHVPLYQQARLDLYQRLMTSRAQNNAGLVRPTMPVTDNSWMPVQGGGVSQGTRRSQQRKLLLHAFRPEHIHYSCHNCSPICAAACGPQPPAPSLCQSHVTI
jgi:hypothetical protein